MSDDSIVLCVYFIVLGVVVIVGMGGISCVSKEEKAIDDAVEKIPKRLKNSNRNCAPRTSKSKD